MQVCCVTLVVSFWLLWIIMHISCGEQWLEIFQARKKRDCKKQLRQISLRIMFLDCRAWGCRVCRLAFSNVVCDGLWLMPSHLWNDEQLRPVGTKCFGSCWLRSESNFYGKQIITTNKTWSRFLEKKQELWAKGLSSSWIILTEEKQH